MGKDAPPEITNGSFVSWSGGKGRVDLVVSNGKVPGVDDDVEGTAKSPAARVVVWENDKPTRKKIGVSTHTLKRIAPIRGGQKKSGPAALVEILAEHEQRVEDMALPAYAAVSGKSIKAVYDRGLVDHPGGDLTILTAEQWATGRVEHFVKVAAAVDDTAVAPGNDTDLLDPTHPLYQSAPIVDETDDQGLFEGAPVEPQQVAAADVAETIDSTEVKALLARFSAV